MPYVNSFPPLIDKRSQILILGSMPGVESIQRQQYYAHSRNQFWKIIYNIFSVKLEEDYEQKLEFLKQKRIALWDVIASCNREGRLEANIKEEMANDFSNLFQEYTTLKAVFFNGAKAYDTYKKLVGMRLDTKIDFVKLTSTSPANTKKFAEKFNEWKVIRSYLE